MPRKFYCDYCSKHIPHTIEARRAHMQGALHREKVRLHYEHIRNQQHHQFLLQDPQPRDHGWQGYTTPNHLPSTDRLPPSMLPPTATPTVLSVLAAQPSSYWGSQ
ncbi:hypothetical protein BASA81_014506 [Batrachochytrium salamandrivorans]|nr:hypothetical protein BASA81_014506 [Batrachochytrium salamandrivorans]